MFQCSVIKSEWIYFPVCRSRRINRPVLTHCLFCPPSPSQPRFPFVPTSPLDLSHCLPLTHLQVERWIFFISFSQTQPVKQLQLYPPPSHGFFPTMLFLWWDFLSEGILWSCSLFPNKFPWFFKSGFNQHNHSLFSDINSLLICSCNSRCVFHLSGCFIYTHLNAYICVYILHVMYVYYILK